LKAIYPAFLFHGAINSIPEGIIYLVFLEPYSAPKLPSGWEK